MRNINVLQASLMMMSRIILIAIILTCVIRTYLLQGWESALGMLSINLITASTIIYSRFWATYILPFGFWEHKATDFKKASQQWPVIKGLGWFALGLMLWAVLFIMKSTTPHT